MKKILSILLCVVLLLGVIPMSVFATEEKQSGKEFEMFSDKPYESCGSVNTLRQYANLSDLRQTLFNGFYNCQEYIYLSSFNIPDSQRTALFEFIWDEMGECFHVGSLGYASGMLKVFDYTYSASEYQQMYAQLVAAKDEFLVGIKGNNTLNDADKALLIHDKLALMCEYDYSYTNYDCYGALVNGSTVCQGYAEAYDYLLEEVGIESYLCESDTLVHAWNIIYIGGRPYHVDVTWDDIAWASGKRGVEGAVSHENFLRSSNGIYATGHEAFDYDVYPTDTTYDNYYWQNSETAFHLIGNKIYYIDNVNSKLKTTNGTELCSVSSTWYVKSGGYYYLRNYSRLSTDGVNLYYSVADSVYKYDIATGQSTQIFKPDVDETYYHIYGFIYEDGYLVCDINEEPPASRSDVLQQVKEAYCVVAPNGTTITNNYEGTAIISQGGEMAEYIFTPTTTGEYVIYSTSSEDTRVYLYNSNYVLIDTNDDGGEDYNFRLQCRLTAGVTYTFKFGYYSITKVGTIPFCMGGAYTLTYNANGGSGAPSSITKDFAFVFNLSTSVPTRAGYRFLGWSTNRNATEAEFNAGHEIRLSGNTTLYAVWRSNGVPALTMNSTNKAVISTGGQEQKYTFTPTVSGKYVIYSTGSADTKVYLYDSDGLEIAYDDDHGDGTNFWLEYNLTAGTTYEFGVKYWGSSKTGTITFKFGRVYAFSYNVGSGWGAPESQPKYYGQSLTLSSKMPNRSGYAFLGWDTSKSATTVIYRPGDIVPTGGNTTLYAVWKRLTPTYNNTYNTATVTGCDKNALSVTVPSSFTYNGKSYKVTAIGSSAFRDCTKLTSVTLPNTLKSIGGAAFYGCSSLTSITIPNTVTNISNSAFYLCTNLQNVTLSKNVKTFGEWVFGYCTSLETVTVPEGITTLGKHTFRGCYKLETINLPSTLISIGNAAFYNCRALKNINIPTGVTNIGNYLFYNCYSLETITLPNAKRIGSYAFQNCSKLATISIPKTLTTVGQYAFNGCNALSTVNYAGTQANKNNISIETYNVRFKNATWYYNR